jgi:RNA polymerase sigma factor, sigma-70 family
MSRTWRSRFCAGLEKCGALPADREIHHLAANHHTQSRFNEARRRKRHPGDLLDVHEGEEALALVDSAGRIPDEQLLEAELQREIDRAILALPEKQRMALVLRRYEDKSYEEIGEVLGLSIAAVKSLLFRARTELRAALNRYLER